MRTFLAIDLSCLFFDELKEWFKFHNTLDRVRWNPPGIIHITLHFFGETFPGQIPEIREVAARIASETAPFPLSMEGIGYFSDDKNPRVIWAGIKNDGTLEKLRDKIETALKSAGFPCEERAFNPHGTLGRPKPGFIPRPLEFPATETRMVEALHLYHSIPGPSGPVYEILETYPFSRHSA